MIELVEKRKKGLLLALCVLFVSCACFAQDIIITKDSKKIKAKVVRIDVDNVRYKNFDNQNGPSLTVLKTDVASILYENGEVETFENGQNASGITTVTDNSGLNSATANGKTTVYIIRNSSIGSLIKMGVECNDLKIGSTKAKQYVYTVLDPGNYTFVSTAENKASLSLTLEPGKIYYINQQVKMGIIKARTGLELMNEADGIKALNDCKLSSDNIYVASLESSENNGDLQVSQATIYINPALVQNDEDKSISNGTLEILTISVPDSIVFKFVEGKISKKSKVYACLVYNGKEISPKEIVASPVLLKADKNGYDTSYTDETKFYVRNFYIDANAKVEKIKFVVDGATMFYNLEKSKWE